MSSEHPILIFDVEATGRNKERDQIIELAMQFATNLKDGPQLEYALRLKPQVPIEPGATAVHGITMEQLEGCGSFADHADEITEDFSAAEVIIGYNVDFDIAMLTAEFERISKPPPDFTSKIILDPYRLWQRQEPRGLQQAHQRFAGGAFEGAHGALADVGATWRVLAGMLKAFGLEDKGSRELALFCNPDRANWVGNSGHIVWKDGTAVLTFGKNNGRKVIDVVTGDPGYVKWMCADGRKGMFPRHVVKLCKQALEMRGKPAEFQAWLVETYGAPPPA